jgi:hypothetical protein
MTAYLFIAVLVVGVFAVDMTQRWWRETRWQRRQQRSPRRMSDAA